MDSGRRRRTGRGGRRASLAGMTPPPPCCFNATLFPKGKVFSGTTAVGTTLAEALWATGAAPRTPRPADRGGPGLAAQASAKSFSEGPSVRRSAPSRRFAGDAVFNVKWRSCTRNTGSERSFSPVGGHGAQLPALRAAGVPVHRNQPSAARFCVSECGPGGTGMRHRRPDHAAQRRGRRVRRCRGPGWAAGPGPRRRPGSLLSRLAGDPDDQTGSWPGTVAPAGT